MVLFLSAKVTLTNTFTRMSYERECWMYRLGSKHGENEGNGVWETLLLLNIHLEVAFKNKKLQ